MSEPTETIATVGARPPAAPPPTTGPVRLLVLVAGGLGLVLYVIGYFGGLALLNITPVPALLLGGGLLAAATLLPQTGRLLVPAAVAVTVGVLLLMQVVLGLGGLSGGVNSVGRGVTIPTIGIVVVILAFLQLAAVVAALLISVGVLTPSSAGGFGQRGGRGRRGEHGQQPPPGYGPGFNPGYGQGAYGPGPGGYPPQGPPGAYGGGPGPGPYGAPQPGGFAPGGYPPHGQPPPPGGPGYGPPFDPQTGPPSGPLPQSGPVQRPQRVQRPWGEVTDPGMAAVTPADEAPGAAPDSPPPSTPDSAKMTLLDVSPADQEPRSFEPPRAYGARAESAPSALEDTPRDDAEEQDDRSNPPASLSIDTPDRRSTEYIANPRDPDGGEQPRS